MDHMWMSSNINEVIRAVLNFFFFEKILHAQKGHKAQKAQKTQNELKAQKAPKAPKSTKKTQNATTQKHKNANKRTKIKKCA